MYTAKDSSASVHTTVSKKQQDRTPRETEIGKIVRAKRQLDNLSLRAAADLIDFEHSGLSDIENGLRSPGWETLVKIHEGLKIPLEDLIRAAAKDARVKMSDRSDRELASALTARAEAFPDLLKVLQRLERADPAKYRMFLKMFDVFEQSDDQPVDPES
jgi:transcriptional regulator with XRE-family HTH domain